MSKTILLIVGVVLTLGILYFYPKLKRLKQVNSLFFEENILSNFQRMEHIVEVNKLTASRSPLMLKEKLDYSFPESFPFQGSDINVEEFLNSTRTEGLLIIQNDTIIYEDYDLGLTKDKSHISWSMSKSFISTLVGIMIDQNKIDIHKTVEHYLPDFAGTGYEGVKVKDLMQMSSGVLFDEEYGDFNSDINRFGRVFALGGSFNDFAKSLKNERPPGTFNHYVSIDTQVLGILVASVSGKSLTELTQTHIWNSMGMEYEGSWIVDGENFELALGGLNATLRDYAKLGLLYLHNGEINGNRIVSEEYVRQATQCSEKHLLPNDMTYSDNHFGYGYQWWIPQFPQNDFFATGIYFQFVYVNRDKNLVIAKLSADHKFNDYRHLLKDQHVAFFQYLAQQLS